MKKRLDFTTPLLKNKYENQIEYYFKNIVKNILHSNVRRWAIVG